MPVPALSWPLALTTSQGGSDDHCCLTDGDIEVLCPKHFPLVTVFSQEDASLSWLGLQYAPPLPMTFKALHDLAPVYLAHSPTNCRAPLACSQFL